MTEGTNVNVQNVTAGHAENVGLTMEQAKQTTPNSGPSAESLGVTAEQFAKYFDKNTGQYNWQAHAKEVEFKLAQRGAGKSDDGGKSGDGKQVKLSDNDAENAVKKAGLDFAALESKVIDKGDIDAADYKALADIGIPEDVVKTYIENITDRALRQFDAVMAAFGGEANFEKVREFARKNYSAQERAELEQMLADPNRYKLAVDLLLSKAGLPPVEKGTVVNGPNAAAPSTNDVKPYKDQSEMIRDQRDPRYKTDPAFREQVYRRAAVSTWQMNPRAHTSGL